MSKLNKAGIRLLADDLVKHAKRYDQNVFGRVDECGTVACLAGFCAIREVGTRRFTALVEGWNRQDEDGFYYCVPAGLKQLGLTGYPAIFGDIPLWPQDLEDLYWSGRPFSAPIAALYALQRLLPDGSIDKNPKAVHTRLTQLKVMLEKQKRAEAKK
jgi:hypothetical protein